MGLVWVGGWGAHAGKAARGARTRRSALRSVPGMFDTSINTVGGALAASPPSITQLRQSCREAGLVVEVHVPQEL